MDAELAIAFPITSEISRADGLRSTDRGRLVAIETPAATYVGHIDSIIFFSRGDVQVKLSRGGAEASVHLKDDADIRLSDQWLADKEN